MNKCNSISNTTIFQEAISHCRWKKVLHPVLKEINILQFENKSFNEIMIEIYRMCHKVEGIGMLTIYDIVAAICRYYKIAIDKVYIIGNGPKRAVKLLNIKPKMHKINNNIKLKYLDKIDIIQAFKTGGFQIDTHIQNGDGDILETYLCNWQKNQ